MNPSANLSSALGIDFTFLYLCRPVTDPTITPVARELQVWFNDVSCSRTCSLVSGVVLTAPNTPAPRNQETLWTPRSPLTKASSKIFSWATGPFQKLLVRRPYYLPFTVLMSSTSPLANPRSRNRLDEPSQVSKLSPVRPIWNQLLFKRVILGFLGVFIYSLLFSASNSIERSSIAHCLFRTASFFVNSLVWKEREPKTVQSHTKATWYLFPFGWKVFPQKEPDLMRWDTDFVFKKATSKVRAWPWGFSFHRLRSHLRKVLWKPAPGANRPVSRTKSRRIPVRDQVLNPEERFIREWMWQSRMYEDEDQA